MKVIIVGAGLGGLSAALCFARKGHEVQLFEQRSALSPQGSGINIRPGASRIMHRWGLHDDLERISDTTRTVILRALQSGCIATRSVLVDVSEHRDWGTMRDVLIDMLYRRAVEAGAQVTFDTSVAKVSETSDVAFITLRDGQHYKADLILAADGIRSKMRAQILSDIKDSTEPLVSETTIYGIRLATRAADKLFNNPEAMRLVDNVNINTWMGQNGFVVTRWSNKLQAFAGLFAIKSKTDQKSLWDESGDLDYVREVFASSCKDLTIALDMATSCDRWKLAEMPTLSRWTSKGGRVILLGDSAHAMYPSAAQGFSQTVEDIGVLDYLFSLEPDPATQVPRLTELWQRIRKTRVECVKDYAKWNTQLFLGEPLVKARGDEVSVVRSLKSVAPDMHAKYHSAAFVKWTLDYDAIAEVRIPDLRQVCGADAS